MSQEYRRELIGKNLGIKPISHGQIYTCQIALSESERPNLAAERKLLLENSLVQHQSNLEPLIVRRTSAYGDDIDYEVVYGADWFLVAQELDIEMLWAWVFDFTDEQAAIAKAEMESLVTIDSVNFSTQPSNTTAQSLGDDTFKQMESLFKRFERGISKELEEKLDQKISNLLKPFVGKIEQQIDKKLEEQNQEIRIIKYFNMTVAELKELAKQRDLTGYSKLKKKELVNRLCDYDISSRQELI